MALERIAAIGVATPVRNPTGAGSRQPATGETIEFTFEAAAADELIATNAEGVQFKLAGLGSLAADLTAGDVLLMKVLATTPRLELVLYDTAARPGAQARTQALPADRSGMSSAFENEQAAMRPDQVAWLRQMVWRPPDTATMATSWRTLMLGQLERQAIQREPGIDPWTLAAFAWNGLRVKLRVLPADPDGAPPPRYRDAAPLTLRIVLILPRLGGVTVQLQLAADGVLLDLAAEHAEALQPLRNLMPTIVAALARIDLRVLRCRLARGLPNGISWNPTVRPATALPAASPAAAASARGLQARIPPETALPQILFRAAAEVVAALSAA
jgi:Flagellar hook-length control protein FliK